MVRQANAIDFWRGIALVTIFINHIPGIVYERLTHRNLSISDSAELFVFLAGWSLRHVVGKPDEPLPIWRLVARLGGRALTLYAAQMLIISIAIATLAIASRALDNPLLLEWHNAAAVFQAPVEAHIGLVLLSHQLGYFDILPLYVALMVMAPIFAVIDRIGTPLLVAISVAVYFAALIFEISFPTWPVEGEWYFNPLAWQLVFVLGFVFARRDGPGAFIARHSVPVRGIAAVIVAAGAVVQWFGLFPDPTAVPEPKLLFINSKSYLTPMRLVQFLALVMLFSGSYRFIARWARRLAEFGSMLGRNSLQVFCVASLLSLIAQIARFVLRGGLWADTTVVLCGIAIMAMTAWVTEWRERLRAPASPRASVPSY